MSDIAVASSIIGGCGLLITLAYNKENSKLARHRMQKELFTEFNKRYDKINGDLNILGEASQQEFMLRFTKEDYKRIKQSIYDFFNLCAEEYYWHKKKESRKKFGIAGKKE